MNKLFIFEPCDKWDYCGGIMLVIAKDLSHATELVHQHLKDEKIEQEKNFQETWHINKGDTKNQEHKDNHIKEFERTINLPLSDFIKQNSIEGIGEEFKTKGCGHYWELFDEIPTEVRTFGNGKTVYINYNYA